jgi:hypothetical protein
LIPELFCPLPVLQQAWGHHNQHQSSSWALTTKPKK